MKIKYLPKDRTEKAKSISNQEKKVLYYIMKGNNVKFITTALGLKQQVVSVYIRRIEAKFKVVGMVSIYKYCQENKITLTRLNSDEKIFLQ